MVPQTRDEQQTGQAVKSQDTSINGNATCFLRCIQGGNVLRNNFNQTGRESSDSRVWRAHSRGQPVLKTVHQTNSAVWC